ncbi:hypothetical protein BH10PLA2_BH10PLA2_14810 [soil metagenome]
MKSLFLLVVVGLMMGADDKKEADQLKGTWNVTALSVGGNSPPEIKGSFTFDGKEIKIKLGEQDHQGTYKLESSKKPKEIDITPGDGPQAGKLMRGIYSIAKDELKLCLAHAEQDRPKSLDNPGDNVIAVTLKKAK